jgi:hypothetical protein
MTQNVAPTIFWSKLVHKFVCGKIWPTLVIFKKVPNKNNRPIAENSPNLVTLFGAEIDGCTLTENSSVITVIKVCLEQTLFFINCFGGRVTR